MLQEHHTEGVQINRRCGEHQHVSVHLLCYISAASWFRYSSLIGFCFALLAAIALNEVDDVRPVLEFYSQFDDPIAAFREKQRQLQVTQCFSVL